MKILTNALLYIGYISILIAAIIFPYHFQSFGIEIAVPITILGGILLFIYRAINPIECEDRPRAHRLQFQLLISTFLYFLTAYLMYALDHRWIISLLVAVLIDAIVAFRTPKEKK